MKQEKIGYLGGGLYAADKVNEDGDVFLRLTLRNPRDVVLDLTKAQRRALLKYLIEDI